MKLNEDQFIEAMKKAMELGIKERVRHVSYREYKILEQMALDKKLDVMGYPKPEHLDEYIKLMGEIKNYNI